MDNNLLSAFSQKALSIYQSFRNLYTSKEIDIVKDQKIFVELMLDKYLIHLDFSMPQNIVETSFVHELFHCFQKEEGFPNVAAMNPKHSDVAGIISSTILDLDVNKRLSNHGYTNDIIALNHKIEDCKNKLLFAKVNNEMYKHIQSLNEHIYTSAAIAFCRIYLNNSKEINQTLNIVKSDFIDIYNAQNIIYDSINLFKYDTPRKTSKIFKRIIRGLGLEEYIKIV